jgi:hypothetical protein
VESILALDHAMKAFVELARLVSRRVATVAKPFKSYLVMKKVKRRKAMTGSGRLIASRTVIILWTVANIDARNSVILRMI